MFKAIRRQAKKKRIIIAVSDFEGGVRLATSTLRMTGPLWDDRSLDAADVSGLFCAVLVRHAMPRRGNVNASCDDEDRWRAGSTMHCIVEVSRLLSLRLARAGERRVDDLTGLCFVAGWLANAGQLATCV